MKRGNFLSVLVLTGIGITICNTALPQKVIEGAECDLPGGKKVQKLYESAEKERTSFKRREIYKQVLEEEPRHYKANFYYAEEIIKRSEKDLKIDVRAAIKPLKIVLEECPTFHPYPYYYLGSLSLGAKKYDEALGYFEKFMNFEYADGLMYPKDFDEKMAEVEQMKATALYYKGIYDNPVPFDPKVVKGVSSKDNEYLAIISPDNNLALYIRNYYKKSKNDLTPKWVEEFTYSKRVAGGGFDEGQPFPPPFNLTENVGGAMVTLNNKTMYLTICAVDATGYKNCDIYTSDNINGEWSEPKALGPGVNGESSFEGQPTITADGKTLYFVSIRKDEIGDEYNMDLYESQLDENGKWGTAKNLGTTINTKGNEKTPFIHTDSQTLYFSSGDSEYSLDGGPKPGHPGIGGFDIFYTRKDENGNWMKPTNIGYPINTEKDDVSFFVSTGGKMAYFSSNELDEGVGGWDLYSFELYKEARPEAFNIVKGTVDKDPELSGRKPKVELKNVRTREVTEIPVDSVSGQYVAVVQASDDYVMTVKTDESAFNSVYIKSDTTLEKVEAQAQEAIKVDVEVKKMKKGGTYKINNINYETNSYELEQISKVMLTEFAEFLKANPSMKVAIHGHTDIVGSDQDNMILSENRSKSVYEYLIGQGINKGRLSYKGFGKSKPIDTNNTEEGRAKNRRTEFVITSL